MSPLKVGKRDKYGIIPLFLRSLGRIVRIFRDVKVGDNGRDVSRVWLENRGGDGGGSRCKRVPYRDVPTALIYRKLIDGGEYRALSLT